MNAVLKQILLFNNMCNNYFSLSTTVQFDVFFVCLGTGGTVSFSYSVTDCKNEIFTCQLRNDSTQYQTITLKVLKESEY